jgi:hypothetical protein
MIYLSMGVFLYNRILNLFNTFPKTVISRIYRSRVPRCLFYGVSSLYKRITVDLFETS